MGLTGLEARSCGCAVLLPENGGCLDFAEDRSNALICDTSDFDLVMSKASELVENPGLRENLQINAIPTAMRFFPEKAAFSMLDELFPDSGRRAPISEKQLETS